MVQASCELPAKNEDQDLTKIFQEIKLRHPVLDFYLPHEYGGLGDCLALEKYSTVNTFPKSKDIPLIKPKTTIQNRNEFNVNIEKFAQNLSDSILFDKWIVKRAEEPGGSISELQL
jgi:hypothetical protein